MGLHAAYSGSSIQTFRGFGTTYRSVVQKILYRTVILRCVKFRKSADIASDYVLEWLRLPHCVQSEHFAKGVCICYVGMYSHKRRKKSEC